MSLSDAPSSPGSPGEGSADGSLPVAACCDGQDWCSVLCTAERLSRKWHAVIVHRLLVDGPLGFAMLQNRISGISGKVLTESLETMEEQALIERKVLTEVPLRVAYRLTRAGLDLAPVVRAMQEWGRRYLAGQ